MIEALFIYIGYLQVENGKVLVMLLFMKIIDHFIYRSSDFKIDFQRKKNIFGNTSVCIRYLKVKIQKYLCYLFMKMIEIYQSNDFGDYNYITIDFRRKKKEIFHLPIYILFIKMIRIDFIHRSNDFRDYSYIRIDLRRKKMKYFSKYYI